MTKQTTLNIDRDELRATLVVAVYYLRRMHRVGGMSSSGETREIVSCFGTFDELIEQIDEQRQEEAERFGVCENE